MVRRGDQKAARRPPSIPGLIRRSCPSRFETTAKGTPTANTTEFFGQDSWKINRRLTLELGLRVSHLGQWYDRQGFGFAVWNPATYNSAPDVPATDYTGLLWHKRDPKVPLSCFGSRALLWAP